MDSFNNHGVLLSERCIHMTTAKKGCKIGQWTWSHDDLLYDRHRKCKLKYGHNMFEATYSLLHLSDSVKKRFASLPLSYSIQFLAAEKCIVNIC